MTLNQRYKTKADGKLHTSFSELKRCRTPQGTLRVVQEKYGEVQAYQGGDLEFGTIRHQQWEQESKNTGLTPECFHGILKAPVDYIEHAFAVEIFKDVILHFRPDAVSVSERAVIDYKTLVGRIHQYSGYKQLIIYAFGLSLHNIRITKSVYLGEKWNKEHTEILDYVKLERTVSMFDLAHVKEWLRPRAELLNATNKLYLRGKL